MRIKVVILLVSAAGLIVASSLIFREKTLESGALEKIRTACPECHGEVPTYDAAAKVHGRHAAFECGRCHGGSGSLKTTDSFHSVLIGIFLGVVLLALAGLTVNQGMINRKRKPSQAGEPRTVVRFSGRAIMVHWFHAASFSVMLITGVIMFFDLADMDGGRLVRNIHKACAVFFVALPVLFSLFDPRAAAAFLKEAFRWSRDDLSWFRSWSSFSFGRKIRTIDQGYLNGDQRLWQFVTFLTGTAFTLTGILMWFFKLKLPVELYQWILLAHAASFVLTALLFLVHLYLTLLHPKFGESLSSMVDGKISETYAKEHHAKWYGHDRGAKGS